MRKIILTIVLAILTTSLTAQIVEDTTKRETISQLYHDSLERIDGDLYVKYRNTEYNYIDDMRHFLIGGLTNYNSFKEAVLDAFKLPKYEAKRFTLNDKYFLIQKINKRQVWIFIYDGNIKTSMGIYDVKNIHKLLPELN